jgi:hypothetical protein
MPPDHDALVSAIGRIEAVTSTLVTETNKLREFKDKVLAICPVHEQRIEGVESRVSTVETSLKSGSEWMIGIDMQRAQFSGGWKLIVLLGAALSACVAFLASIKGMLHG